MKLKIQMSKVKTILLVILIHFFSIQPALAADCPANETPVPSEKQLGNKTATNHTYTGQPCSNMRYEPGSAEGPGNFGIKDNSSCIGACKYWVTYCTTDQNSNQCQVKYPEPSCDNAPSACSDPYTAALSPVGQIFGQIIPPAAIIHFGFGRAGINKFLSNLIQLIYILAMIVLVFMIIWGAWDWMTSEGDKEKLDSARKKLVNAFVGILLFAAAFAIIRVLGQFTGFTFFAGQ